MSNQYCFLCASDEGVFLDVTANNKQMYYDQLEICSLIKVLKADQLPTKICHKCAYELHQCSSFIEKYKRATKQKINVRRQCCSLCREPAKNEFIFDISKEKNLQYNPFHKIQELLNTKNGGKVYGEYKFICLSCRYVIDVLIDLRNICEETTIKLEDTADKKINYVTFPKIKTTIVNRKTTSTEPNRINLNVFLESESDSDEMTRTRSRNKLNEQKKSQVCSKCHNSIKTDGDIFKIHKTGEIVCKCCWKNMDICKSKPEKEVSNDKQIKLCTVFLKDVLKDSKIKKEKLYRIDEDDEGNKTYVVMDTNLTNENKSSKPVSGIRSDTEKQSQKRSSKSLRTADKDSSSEDIPNKKHKPDAKEISEIDSKQSSLVAQQAKQVTQKDSKHNINQSSDSDSSIPKIAKNSGRRLTRHKRATGSSLSDADIDNKYNRKRLKTILSGIPIKRNRNVDVSDESSSNEDIVSKRKQRLSFTSTSSVTIEICDDDNDQENFEKNVRKTNRKNAKKLVKLPTVTNSQELQSPKSDDKDDIFKTQTYVCDECGASYENKFMGLTHKLTHYKQPQLKLQKLSNETWMKETSGPSEAIDDQVEDLSETIKITVEDDEEELMESEKNFNTSKRVDINSNTGSNINSPKKEAVEDAVDVKLVMKESDDDQTHKTEKETEDLQEDEVVEINIISSSQNGTKTKEDTDKENEKENEGNYNNNDETDKNIHGSIKCVNSELINSEIMGILHSDSEDKQVNNNEKCKQMEEDKQENEEDKRKNEEGKQENEEDKRENEKGKQENEEDKSKVEEKQTEIVEEVEEVKVVEQVKVVKERDGEEDAKRDLDIKDDEKGKQGKEQKEAICNGQAIETINKESLKKFSEDCVEDTMEENDIDVSKKIEQSDIKHKETNNGTDVADDEADLTILAEQRSPKSTQKGISCNENRMQIKVDDSDSKKSEVLERTVLLEEDTTDKQNFNRNDVEIVDVDSPQRKDSMSDSANAAAEVLREVLDLASAEVVKRQEVIDINIDTDSIETDFIETETLENISREIQNIVDMPCLKIDDCKTENETHVE